MTYDQWKCTDPNEPFADHEEEKMPMPTEPSALEQEAYRRYPQETGTHRRAFIAGAKWATSSIANAVSVERTATAQGEPVAFVPVHPRQGPLWSDTYAAGSAVERSTHYEQKPLYAAPFSLDIAEDCAKIAEGHVCNGDNIHDYGYDEACRDIAKAIRDAHGERR